MSASPAPSEVLQALLAGCRRGDRAMQQRLYGLYYSYALGICLRYTRQRDEAEEVVNDGFLKAFRDICRFDAERYELSSSFSGLAQENHDSHGHSLLPRPRKIPPARRPRRPAARARRPQLSGGQMGG